MDTHVNGLGRPALTAALLLAVAGLGSCTKARGTGCDYPDGTSVFCPPGTQCAAKQAICIDTPCGNGHEDPDEKCDDGNTIAGDGCSSDCSSNEQCNNGVWDKGPPVFEVCDATAPDYTGSCNELCTSTNSCGDGTVNSEAEECDRGLENGDDQDCTTQCKWNVCGDKKKHATREDCDGGAQDATPKTTCPNYGDRSCELCSVCKHVAGVPHYCGDGHRDADRGEACDGGVTRDPTSCPYGQATCTLCSARCQELQLTGPYCGNGVPEPVSQERTEGCDNLSSFLCGTCTPPSSSLTPSCTWLGTAKATGSITFHGTASGLVGNTFTLGGFGDQRRTFLFTYGSISVPGGVVGISLAGTGAGGQPGFAGISEIANRTQDAVQNETPITAHVSQTGSGANTVYSVVFENELAGASGNVAIEIDNDITPANAANLTRTGMSNGRGCRVGQPCATGADCVDAGCTAGVCKN